MNIAKIFFKKIPLFLNEKHSNIIFDYLRKIKEIYITDKKNKIALFDILYSKSQKI